MVVKYIEMYNRFILCFEIWSEVRGMLKKVVYLFFTSIIMLGLTSGCESAKEKERKKEIRELNKEMKKEKEKIDMLNDYLELCEKAGDC